MEEINIKEKADEIAKGILAVQEKVTNLEKKYDGLDHDAVERVSAETAKKFEDMQSELQKIKADEMMERLLNIETSIVDGQKKRVGESDPEHKKDFYNYLRRGKEISKDTIHAYCEDVAKKTLIHADSEKMAAYTKDLVEGSNPAGGYFITPERSAQIMRRIFETSPIRTVANVVTTSSDVLEMIIDDNELDCGWVGEVEARPNTTTPQIGLLSIPVHELYAQPIASQRILDDAGFDIEGWLQSKVTDKFSRTENTSFVVGDGSKKPKGFLSYDAWAVAGIYERNKIEQITATGTAGSLDEPDDLITLQMSLKEPYQMGAVWGMTRGTFADIMKLKTSDTYLINPYLMKEGTTQVMLGKPIVIMADMPEVASASLPVVYGDFMEGYTIVDRFGVRVLRDPYTTKPYVKFYSTKRVGGAVSNFESIKILVINS